MTALTRLLQTSAIPCKGPERADEWWNRFDPNAYTPVAPRGRKCVWPETIGPTDLDRSDPTPDLEQVEAHSEEASAAARPVRGLAVGLDKTELDEKETRAFHMFVRKAHGRKIVHRRRVRMLPSDESGP